MASMKHRVSNVLAWTGFLFAAYILVFAGLTAGKLDSPSCFHNETKANQTMDWLLDNEDKEGTPAYDRHANIFLSLSDEIGEGCSGSLWMSEFKVKRNYDGFSLAKLSQLNYLLIAVVFGILNYLMVGSFRVFPWKQVGEDS